MRKVLWSKTDIYRKDYTENVRQHVFEIHTTYRNVLFYLTIFFVSEPVKVDWFYPSVHNKFANRTCIFISLKIRLFFKHYENVHGEQKEGFIVYN